MEGLRFYLIPKIHDNANGLHALSAERHKRWLQALNRNDINIMHSRVCSRHFVTGKSAMLRDSTKVDWVPTLNLGDPEKHDMTKVKIKLRRTDFDSKYNSRKPTNSRAQIGNNPKNLKRVQVKQSTTNARLSNTTDAVVVASDEDSECEILPEVGGDENLEISDSESLGENGDFDYTDPTVTFVPVLTECRSLGTNPTPVKAIVLKKPTTPASVSKQQTSVTAGDSALKKLESELKKKERTEKEELFQTMLNAYEQKIKDLNYELNELKFRIDLNSTSIESLRLDDERVKNMTGLQNFTVLSKLYDVVKDSLPDHSATGLTQFNSFVITLMKLRLDLPISLLSYFFRVDPQKMGKMYRDNLAKMNKKIGPLVRWPDDTTLLSSTPDSFKQITGEKCVIFIHFLEMTLKNLNPLNTMAEYSKHKVVYLIAFSPSGEIIFVSQGFGSKASREDIIRDSGFFDKITENHIFLSVKEMYEDTFKDCEEVQSLKEIAKQTETKVLDILRDNFRILFNRQVANFNGEVYSEFTVRCCCALANLQMPELMVADTKDVDESVVVHTN